MPNLHNRYKSAERNISQKKTEYMLNYSFWLILKQQWTIKIVSRLFSIFSLAAILVGIRDHRTQFWKGAIQGSFQQGLVEIGSVVSEEKIKMWKANDRRRRQTTTTDHGRRTTPDGKNSHGHWPGELKKWGGWKFQLRLLFVFKLNILPIWREYPMTYFTKHKTLRS